MKISTFVLLVSFALFVGCNDSLDKTGLTPSEHISTDTTIDAASSATKKIKVLGGNIYSDSAVIDFWYLYDNGVTLMKVIDNKESVVIGHVINKPPYSYPPLTDNFHTLKPLTPVTDYRLIINGVWVEGNKEVWSIDTIHFTTREK